MEAKQPQFHVIRLDLLDNVGRHLLAAGCVFVRVHRRAKYGKGRCARDSSQTIGEDSV
jgi:hypothetical protein